MIQVQENVSLNLKHAPVTNTITLPNMHAKATQLAVQLITPMSKVQDNAYPVHLTAQTLNFTVQWVTHVFQVQVSVTLANTLTNLQTPVSQSQPSVPKMAQYMILKVVHVSLIVHPVISIIARILFVNLYKILLNNNVSLIKRICRISIFVSKLQLHVLICSGITRLLFSVKVQRILPLHMHLISSCKLNHSHPIKPTTHLKLVYTQLSQTPFAIVQL
jgi:hypothetical protein